MIAADRSRPLQQVEGVQEHSAVVVAIPQQLERGHSVHFAADRLAVDQTRAYPESYHAEADQREAVGPIIAVAGVQAHRGAISTRQQAEAIELDLMNPVAAARR